EAEAGGTCTVGVGMPGAISPATGLVKNANSHWLNGQRFGADLATAPHVFSDRFDTPIRESLHGDASGVRGAAWLWNAG
ncbi:hypothetical protein FV232_28285, partial [Methylobacterium sp. WL30]